MVAPVNLWLVVEYEFPPVQRAAQAVLQREALSRTGAHFLVVVAIAGTAGLSRVQCRLCVLYQRLRRVSIRRKASEPVFDRGRNLPSFDGQRASKGIANLIVR